MRGNTLYFFRLPSDFPIDMAFGRLHAATAVLLVTLAFQASAAPDRYAQEAAFLPRFAQFVSWPASSLPPNAPLVIGLVGDDPIGRSIDRAVAGKHVNGHPIVILHMHWNDSFAPCHMIFISSTEIPHLVAILQATHGLSVLTIADYDRFTEYGGMIELITDDGEMRFDVNPSAAAEAHLKISSRLLQVAHAVRSTVGEP